MINKSFRLIVILILSLSNANCDSPNFKKTISNLDYLLKNFRLLEARNIIKHVPGSILTHKEWLEMRDLLHKYPQVGMDILLNFDSSCPCELNRVDLAIIKADKLMLDKKFEAAAFGYQAILEILKKNDNFNSGRNYQLYWSIIHSLARAFYSLKQYNEAYILYRTIPTSYPFYKQAQFELMWNNYMNNRLEYALGAIATMASGHFSKMLEPEVYLVQYYIFKRMCRDDEVAMIKKRVKIYQEIFTKNKFPFSNWINKDVDSLIYKQILQTGDVNSKEFANLRKSLNEAMKKDILRLKSEFDLIAAHIDLDTGQNKKLEPIKHLLTVEELLSNKNEKWAVDDNEIWQDELGHQVFAQKDLCN